MQFPPHPEWQRVLTDILAAAKAMGPAGVVAFDLDSTLLDNRPRQAAIVRDFGNVHGIAALEGFRAEHLVTGFDTRDALARAGLDAETIARWLPELRRHWVERFFTSEACLEDIPVRGAAAYARRAHATGVQLVYLTARPERMRPGTEEVLRRYGFPLPGTGVLAPPVLRPMLLLSSPVLVLLFPMLHYPRCRRRHHGCRLIRRDGPLAGRSHPGIIAPTPGRPAEAPRDKPGFIPG